MEDNGQHGKRKPRGAVRKRITPAPRRSTSERAELAELKRTDLGAFNITAEAVFIRLICQLVADEGPQTVRAVMSEASFELDISPETAKRYLFKHTARRAHFCFAPEGTVACRPHDSQGARR